MASKSKRATKHQRARSGRKPSTPTDRPVDPSREKTQPAEEWGERIATGRAIARAGKMEGFVPGATVPLPNDQEKREE